MLDEATFATIMAQIEESIQKELTEVEEPLDSLFFDSDFLDEMQFDDDAVICPLCRYLQCNYIHDSAS